MSETRGTIPRVLTAAGAAFLVSACTTTVVGKASAERTSSSSSTAAPSSSGTDCQPRDVYAQNRWPSPGGYYGAAERSQPYPSAPQIASFAGNAIIEVDYWKHTAKAVYPSNTSPWNSDVWIHVIRRDGDKPQLEGWVSFAGVRAAITQPDPTRVADGGVPVALPSNCEGQ